jgi:prophage regulatory protein
MSNNDDQRISHTAMRMRHVEQKTGLKKTKLYELMKADLFPKPIPLMGRGRAWLEIEVEKWLADRISERDTKK